jgi:ATP-dependent protease ClpP protease subunit
MNAQAAARSRQGLDVKTPCRLEIRALAGKQDTAEVMIFGDIGASWDDKSVEAATFVRDLQNVDAKTLNVRINSRGGSVYDGTAIYNALKRHPATVNVSSRASRCRSRASSRWPATRSRCRRTR